MEATSSGLAVMELRYLVPTTHLSCCQPQSLTNHHSTSSRKPRLSVPAQSSWIPIRASSDLHQIHTSNDYMAIHCATLGRCSHFCKPTIQSLPLPWTFLPKQVDSLIQRCRMPSMSQRKRPPLAVCLRHQHRAFRAVSRLHMRVPAQSSIVNRDAIPRCLALEAVRCRSATI